jgi:hypothetical protein
MQNYYAEHRDRWTVYAATQRAKHQPVAVPAWRRVLGRLRGFLAFLTSLSLPVVAMRANDGDDDVRGSGRSRAGRPGLASIAGPQPEEET